MTKYVLAVAALFALHAAARAVTVEYEVTFEGVWAAEHATLLDCPLRREVRVARVIDQRTEFLQLLERHGMMPGRAARVVSRDELAETVEVRPESGEALRLGFRAASRVLVALV